MHITYGIIYYFLVCVLSFTCILPLLVFRKVRLSLLSILQNQLIDTILYFIFAVLIAVLFDSGWTFKELEFYGEFERCIGLVGDSWDNIGVMQREICLNLFRKEKEYFIAQRNFILACSACFVWFVFCRYIARITEIANNELLLILEKQKRTDFIEVKSAEGENDEIESIKSDSKENEFFREPLKECSNKLENSFEEVCTNSSEVTE